MIFVISLFVFFVLPFLTPIPNIDYKKAEDFATRDGEFITVDNVKTFVIDKGPRNAQPIVFLHGFGGSTFTWRRNIYEFMSQGYRVIAFDLKGFGLSSKNFEENYSQRAQADFVKDVLKKLGVTQPVTLIGHSLGANVSLIFAEKYPDKVDKLVLVDAAYVENSLWYLYGLKLLNLPSLERYALLITHWYISDKDAERMIKSAYYDQKKLDKQDIAIYQNPLLLRGWDEVLVGMFRDSYENFIPERLDKIDKPTLIIWGDHDTWADVERGRNLNNKIKGSKLVVIEDSGHLPMEEQFDPFNKAVMKFLEGSDSEKSN